jgi:hypothetical protein
MLDVGLLSVVSHSLSFPKSIPPLKREPGVRP